jgi:hypothetical protein
VRTLLLVLLVEACLWAPAWAEQRAAVPVGTCQPGTDFEREQFTIRSARVEGPFAFLRWIRARLGAAEPDVSVLAGQPYRQADVLRKGDALEAQAFLPEAFDQRVRVSLIVISVENCSNGQLDVVYSVLSSSIAPVLSGTFESRRSEKPAPERAAGADNVTGRLRLSPGLAYDRSEDLSGGGRLEYRRPTGEARVFPLDAITLEGRGSTSMHEVSAALAGAKDGVADWLAHMEWQVDYFNASEPTDNSGLRTNRLAAQFAAITPPLGPLPLALRFGGLLEGGRLDSDFRPGTLDSGTVAGADYGAAKVYVGTTARLDRHTVAASYGVQLGTQGRDGPVDWVKHVGDLAHEVVVPVGDHRALTVESRLTAGLLSVPGTVPVTARFFGGNREEPFVPGGTWNIRSNPVIRSVPANRLDLTRDGPGGTRFFSYNLTAAVPVWRRPVVPSELSRDPQFGPLLNGQLVSATSAVQTGYVSKDPSFRSAAARLPDVLAALRRLLAAVEAAESRSGADLADLLDACTSAVKRAEGRARRAAESRHEAQVGRLAALLSADPDEDRLNKVHAACVTALDGRLQDAALASEAAALERIHLEMERDYARIDQALATRRAETEMAYVKRTVHALVYELNLVSVSPVVMFDVAHIGPASSRLGTRYGIGGGIRLSLANSLDFTAGYLASPHRLAGEPPGAFFFSMQFKDVFQ